jgi:WD40 repeat protein
VFFSHDGKLAVVVGYARTADIWDVATRKQVSELAAAGSVITAVVISADDKRIATIDGSNSVRLFDTSSGNQVSLTEMRGHTDEITALAFSPDGRWLATGSSDHSVRVWDTTTGQAVGEFYGHTESVIAVAFGKNPNSIISVGEEGAIRDYQCEACVAPSELMADSKKRMSALGRTLSGPERRRYLH